MRGPAARIYGLNAMAGAINIVTKIPLDNKLVFQTYVGSGFEKDTTNDSLYVNNGVQITGVLHKNNHVHLLSGSIDRGRGYRYNTAYANEKLFYQGHVKLNDKNSLEATGGYINNDFGANGFYSAPGDKDSKEQVQTAIGSISYNYTPTNKLSIKPRLSYRYNKDDYIYIRQKPEVYHNVHESGVATAELQSTLQLNKGTVGFGAEFRNEQIQSNNLGARKRDNIGIYAEYKHYFSDKLNASAGVYGNYNSDYKLQLFPGADIGYYFLPGWKAFANANFGERLPTYTDLYYKGPTNIGNNTLQPEYAYQSEGRVQYSKQAVFVQASYFYRITTNFIDWVRVANTDPWQPRNFQSVNTQGLAVQAKYDMSHYLNLPAGYQISLSANYTYLNPEIESPTGEISKYVVEALRHQLNLSLRTVLFKRLQLNANGRYLYRINGNDYTLMDTRVAYSSRNAMLFLDINNLLNTKYKEIASVPLLGRWFTFGLRVTIE